MAQLPSRKRRKLELETPDDGTNGTATETYLANASKWNLEQEYETKPRKSKKREKENTRLPIKTAEGHIEHLEAPEVNGDRGLHGVENGVQKNGEEDVEDAKVPANPPKSSKAQIMEAKQELAQIALSINADPEEHIGGLKRLAELAQSPDITVKRLALATQAAVYKDIIPGYRIRQLTDVDLGEKLSKEVRKARAFEQALVGGYQAYVIELAKYAKTSRGAVFEGTASISTVAISCACTLLLAVPHFNFRGELLKIVVDKLSRRRIDDDFRQCISTIETLFQDDEDGNPSKDAVSVLTQMIKKRDYHVDESVLNTLLHLRLLTEFSSRASHNGVEKAEERSKFGKKVKQKREFRTKKQRKNIKELKAVEKEFREADASVRHEERERMQAETLRLVFGTYFRILKARSSRLMGAVLEGLAKFTHLINQEFFGDLLVTLQDLASQAIASIGDGDDGEAEDLLVSSDANFSNPYRTALLCATTAFSLLSAQEAASLELDLSYFARLLYDLLIPLATAPDLELSAKTPRLADPHALSPPSDSTAAASSPSFQPLQAQPTKVNATTLSTLLMRALTGALTPRGTPPVRLAAFVHRLMIFALQTPEKTSLATVTLLRELVRNQGRKVRQLWNTEERRGDGNFEPVGVGMDASKPFCGTVWEGEILRRHYALGVKTGLKELEGLVKDFA